MQSLHDVNTLHGKYDNAALEYDAVAAYNSLDRLVRYLLGAAAQSLAAKHEACSREFFCGRVA